MIKDFLKRNYKHFNSATLVDASEAYIQHLEKGGKMLLAMSGAMSTAEIGISLAEMIWQDKIHAICCSANNLEEDIFNLVAHNDYKRVDWRNLSPQDEKDLLAKGLNRVTDTCIPEEEAMRKVERLMLKLWQSAGEDGERYFPYEFIYQLFEQDLLKDLLQIPIEDSWVYAAWQKKLPIFVPAWEDCTLGNVFMAKWRKGELYNINMLKTGMETMNAMVDWYLENSENGVGPGFFQIGGGTAGDFAICTVPLINDDLWEGEDKSVPLWGYFCQISDSTTSYGSYSGAPPNEKITWGKLDIDTPRFVVESDATIVVPLMFAYILGL